ncbi:Tetratricopeptide repeat protein [Psychrobacter pasteurii]|uniref:Tetratricopeptide repeat protein n=1 Tax=Psychrobacter pasteurii TaxID=1945520 RepID=A0A1R4EGN5_9GAMM|nr:Tetratricopeptide repeat protein [Psychrobacter pasteurii]
MLFLQQFNESKKVTKRVKTRFGESQARLRLTFKQTFSSDLKKAISAKHSKRNSRAASNRKLPKKEQTHQKKPLSLTRQRLLRLCILLSLASMASHSASANVLDPIRRVLSPIISIIDKKDTPDSMAQSTQSRAEPTTLPPNIGDQVVDESHGRLSLTKHRPSLLNVMQAEFLINRGEIDAGLQLYKQEAFKNEATTVFERALELSLLYEMPKESLAFAVKWQQQNTEHVPALFYVAHLALKAHDYNLSGKVLSEILEYDTQADLSEILIGIYPTNESDQRLLLETLLRLPKHDNPSLLVMQAGLMSQLGQPDIALLSVNRALKFKPDNAPFIVLKADILKQLQPDRQVLKFISAERKRLKNNKTLYLYEIRYRLELGETQEAHELLLQAHDLFHDEEVTLLAALVSIDIEAYSQADDLLSALASSPAYIDQAYYYLGISAERQQKFDRAERFLSKVMQENLVLKARQKLVSIQLLQGHPDKALETLRQFSDEFDVYGPESAILQADILRQQDKLTEARNLLAEANKRYPDDTKLMFARAQLLDNEQDTALKRRLLDRLLLIDPENPDYMVASAKLLFEVGNEQDVEQSLNLAQLVLGLPFDSPQFNQQNYLAALNLLAADALSKEQYQQVIEYLEVPYDISPTLDSGIILLRAYQGLNQQDKVLDLFGDIQQRFAVGQQDISDRLQSY